MWSSRTRPRPCSMPRSRSTPAACSARCRVATRARPRPARQSPPESAMNAAAASGVSPLTRCRNCGAEVSGLFCAQCGQETRVELPTLREFIGEATGRLLAVDGRLWRTLFLLVFRPGQLTVEYLNGRRKHYVRPARLFFALSLLMFAALKFGAEPVFLRAVPPAAPT